MKKILIPVIWTEFKYKIKLVKLMVRKQIKILG